MVEKTKSKRTLNGVPDELNAVLEPFHCGECGRVLGLVGIVEGTIALKCRRCKEWNILDVRSLDVVQLQQVDQGLGQLGQKAVAATAAKSFEKGA